MPTLFPCSLSKKTRRIFPSHRGCCWEASCILPLGITTWTYFNHHNNHADCFPWPFPFPYPSPRASPFFQSYLTPRMENQTAAKKVGSNCYLHSWEQEPQEVTLVSHVAPSTVPYLARLDRFIWNIWHNMAKNIRWIPACLENGSCSSTRPMPTLPLKSTGIFTASSWFPLTMYGLRRWFNCSVRQP